MPTVWEAFRRGELDAEQIRIIDRVARRVTEAATLAALDEQAVDAAQTRSPKQLQVWLLRLVVQLEPFAFAAAAPPRLGRTAGHRGTGRGRHWLCHRRSVGGRRRRHRRDCWPPPSSKPGRGRSAHRPATPRRPVRRPAPRPHRLRSTRPRSRRRERRTRRRAGEARRERRDTTNPTIRTFPRPAVSPPRRRPSGRLHRRRRVRKGGRRLRGGVCISARRRLVGGREHRPRHRRTARHPSATPRCGRRAIGEPVEPISTPNRCRVLGRG